MKKCTPFRTKALPGLPQDEVDFMKQTVFSFLHNIGQTQLSLKQCEKLVLRQCKKLVRDYV